MDHLYFYDIYLEFRTFFLYKQVSYIFFLCIFVEKNYNIFNCVNIFTEYNFNIRTKHYICLYQGYNIFFFILNAVYIILALQNYLNHKLLFILRFKNLTFALSNWKHEYNKSIRLISHESLEAISFVRSVKAIFESITFQFLRDTLPVSRTFKLPPICASVPRRIWNITCIKQR